MMWQYFATLVTYHTKLFFDAIYSNILAFAFSLQLKFVNTIEGLEYQTVGQQRNKHTKTRKQQQQRKTTNQPKQSSFKNTHQKCFV